MWTALNKKADAVVHITHTEYRKVMSFLADGGAILDTSLIEFPIEKSVTKILQSLVSPEQRLK